MRRRHLMQLPSLLGLGTAAISPSASSQSVTAGQGRFPDRPVRLLLGFAAGGATDGIARLLADAVSAEAGVPFMVENRPGANANLAAEQAARATPDGTTLLYNTSSLILSPSLYPRLSYDWRRDLMPVIYTSTTPLMLVANNDFPPRDIREFAIYLREHAGRVIYASGGAGNITHLAVLMLLQAIGVSVEHVPYRGNALAVPDLLSGRVQFLMDPVNSVGSQAKAGRMRALAVTGLARSPEFPEVPTIAETIQPGFEAESWSGVMAPANTPAPIIERLNALFASAAANPSVRARAEALGARLTGSSSAAYGEMLAREFETWRRVIAAGDIRLD